MNETPEIPDWPHVPQPSGQAPPPRPNIPVKRKPHDMTPMEGGPGLGNSIAALLKSPGSILYELISGARPGRVGLNLAIVTVLGLAVFGAITGTFSLREWWEPLAKITGGVLFAALICLPSLYIFAALCGMALQMRAIAGILFGTTGLTALLLAGFTPLVWVLGGSTNSLCFIGGLLITVWLVSLLFGMNLLIKCARALGMTDSLHIWVWCFMFLLVTFQVSCAVRPIIGEADSFLPKEKKFFLQHWADNLNKESGNRRTANNSDPEPASIPPGIAVP
jgi:hypothetical protein